MSITFSIHTLGCKVNSYESGVMSECCEKQGFIRVPFGEKADICIINTCAVTAESGRKSMQFIRRARKENPDCIIVAAGCFTQISDDKNFQDVQILLGNREKGRVAEFIKEYMATGNRINRVRSVKERLPFEEMCALKNEHTRAFVKVEDGCDNFCSYCIIPYARGRVCSKPLSQAVEEISALISSGYREVVLTGIHLDSYGKDLENTNLCDLIEAVDAIPGIERLRLGSLEPMFMSEENVARLAKCKHLCPQFHLSLQSGCDATLKRMNRHYTSAEFMNAVQRLNAAFGAETAITTDVIVGFCGETEDEFLQSCEFVKSIGFANIHVFPFSPREGTRAYTMPNQVPNAEKSRRAGIMDGIKRVSKEAYHSALVGTKQTILAETCSPKGDGYLVTGHTRSFVPVEVESSLPVPPSDLIDVSVISCNEDGCKGVIALQI